MSKLGFVSFLLILFTVVLGISNPCGALDDGRKVHIVYMGALPKNHYLAQSHHLNILEQALEGSTAADCLVYSYKRSFNGFAAKLTHQEQQRIARMEGVVAVFESKTYQLHTTRSWDFMGLPSTVRRNLKIESDVIIGVIDTGAWPESESFNDDGLSPPPKKWKGVCQSGGNFTCNKKLIGARFYPEDTASANDSARDTIGHGTHTASTAAGREVKGASLFSLAQGNARGAVPSARIAVYKVCWPRGCFDHGILAAFDDAIADGVDILSVSLGSTTSLLYDKDSIAIGAFHAMQNGILISQSAGNSGPDPQSLSSVAPWIFTVAASTTDRKIITEVTLGDGNAFVGNAINTFEAGGKHPIIYAGDAAGDVCERLEAQNCIAGCLDANKVKEKIVFCEIDATHGREPFIKGAFGMVAKQDEVFADFSSVFPLPSTLLSADMSGKVKSYINSTTEPQATITKSEAIHDSGAPVVVSFSSRGPNTISKDILKPDISAPGVYILAAFPPVTSISLLPEDKRFANYSILSGTSMACPHVTGAAAYVKSFHPEWSPAAIKSALMTTASPMKGNMNVFDYGVGHIDPVQAVNPGLVYDAVEDDYIKMLCSEGFDTTKVGLITGQNTTCPATSIATKDLNYPSMTLSIKPSSPINANFTRTVTNVGSANSVYRATVNPHPQLKILVSPSKLTFKVLGEKKVFDVKVTGATMNDTQSVLASSIVWSDGVHNVKSPIAVYASN